MAITYKKMKTYTVPDGNDKVQYEIVDDAGRKMIAPNWYEHEDDAFTVGQHIEKDGVLYRFTSAHTAEAAWDSSEVTAVSVTGEIESVKSDMNGKASKVSGGTTGNFVSLDANGNIQDSGHKHSDYLTEHQDISGKANKVSGGTANNFAALDANGDLKDSGKKPSDFLTEHQDISGKANKVSGATDNHFAALDGNGDLKDSGKSASDFVASSDFTADKMPMSASDSTKVATAVTELKSQIDGKADLIHDTVQNVAIASVPDAASNLPLTALRFAVNPIQAGSGDPSPQNQRAITGRTSAVVSNAPIYGLGTMLQYGLGDDGAVNSYAYYEHSEYIDLTGINTASIAFTGGASGGWTYRVCGYNASKTFVDLIDKQTLRASDYSFIYDVTNYAHMRVSLVGGCENIVFHAGTQTHPVQFGSTVYGGEVRWTDGKADDGAEYVTFDGTETWKDNGANGYFTVIDPKYDVNQTPTFDYLKALSKGGGAGLGTWQGRLNTSGNNTVLLVKPDMSVYDTKEKWATYLSQNPLHAVLWLAIPTEITLSNLDEIRTVLGGGTMNLWSDSGDIELMEYPCDTKLYIEKLTKPSEDDFIANANIPSGKFFMVGNQLFLSTQAIAQGASIVVGTNCTAFSLADALNAINQ